MNQAAVLEVKYVLMMIVYKLHASRVLLLARHHNGRNVRQPLS
jgi:hypothetical protein